MLPAKELQHALMHLGSIVPQSRKNTIHMDDPPTEILSMEIVRIKIAKIVINRFQRKTDNLRNGARISNTASGCMDVEGEAAVSFCS